MVHIRTADQRKQIHAVRQHRERAAAVSGPNPMRCLQCERFLKPGEAVRLSEDGRYGRHLDPKDCNGA